MRSIISHYDYMDAIHDIGIYMRLLVRKEGETIVENNGN